jgi:hypothetical protein
MRVNGEVTDEALIEATVRWLDALLGWFSEDERG